MRMSTGQIATLYEEFMFTEQIRVSFRLSPVVTCFLTWLSLQGQISHCLARIQEYEL